MTASTLNPQRLGYEFHDKPHPASPGYLRFEIALADAPGGEHFDPDWACLKVVAHTGEMIHLTVRHPWSPPGDQYRACAGQIDLRDRHGKEFTAFTFGGDLRIASGGEETICEIESPAPILDMGGHHTFASLLAVETEVLLAKRAAHWAAQPEQFEKRLAALDPFEFYAACLETLYATYHESRLERSDTHIYDLIHCIEDEIAALRKLGTWPELVCRVEELL